ncbi:MAG TPA: acyl-CoA dehydrogenase family protein [Steroidobacteraceae bacterium]|nr:acyl-CoA dehydrogenase family protein [Steroidobacteraceae bacterium]
MIDLTLTDDQQLLQQTARNFARAEIKPVAERVAREPGCEPWDHCVAMFKRGWELGFTRMLLPEEYGGGGNRMIDAAILLEELGAADVAIAADLFALNMTVPLIIAVAGTADQRRELLGMITSRPTVLSGALSEPNVAGSELFTQDPSPKMGIKTQARRAQSNYVINGQKSAFVTNAGIADHYFVLTRTSTDKPLWESISVFFVDAGTKGLETGPRTRMSGWLTGHHAEVYLDNVTVPATRLLGGEGAGARVMGSLPQMPIGLAAAYVGLARASYEYALDYAKKRHSMGVPIIQHQSVALKLADMYADYHVARLAVWDAALDCDVDAMRSATIKSPLAKTLAVDASIRNAERALQILGAYGITEEYPTARWLNDAWIGYSCDFTRELLRLGMVPFLPTVE